MPDPRQRLLDVGDLRMAVQQAGEPGAGETVVLLHGFPELSYSWRHQIGALAEAGHHVIAPDLRGSGSTTARKRSPERPETFDVVHRTADVVCLLDVIGAERAVLVGHDWGADLAWQTAVLHPERVRAVAGLSVPFVPRSPTPPIDLLRRKLGDDFYMVWFQTPDEPEEALARDVRRTFTTREVWTREWARRTDQPERPRWLEEADLAHYVRAYTRTGFTGGLNVYRNMDRNWELLAPYADRRIEQPALFVTGSRDPVAAFSPHEVMEGWVTDLRAVVVVEGAGHWVQQERPAEVNAALLDFLAGLPAAG